MKNNNFQHPSKDIIESKGTILRGKTVCMCLTGSVAIMNSPIVARELMRLGAEVVCVMSKAATELIDPSLMEWATGNKVITHLTGAVEHIYLAGDRPRTGARADLILICPATANTISKIACGIDDTPVTTVATTAFGSSIPIVIVPAMHESMYKHPILVENEKKLKECGVDILIPRISEGKAKIARIDDIIDRVIDILVPYKDLEGKKVLITAGPTREAIDTVRFISNKSSGKMGIELAKEAAARGADVLLIAGECRAKIPEYIKTTHVVSIDDFIKAVKEEISYGSYDFFISAAAISDYKPIDCIDGKISSDNVEEIQLNMKLTPKIIDVARKKDYNLFIVAFKAESNLSRSELINRAYSRLTKSEVNLIVANDIGREDIGFNSKYNEVYIINSNKHVTHVKRNTKRYIASKILDVTLEAYKQKKSKSS